MAGEEIITQVASPIGMIAVGAGLAIGLAALGTGIAQKDALGAAIGAISEDPKLFSKVLIFAVLPETILIFGFVIAIMLTLIVKGA